MQSPNDILYSIGFAPPDANVRSKPANYFDTPTITIGQTIYSLFTKPVLNPTTNNKKFPQSDAEIFFLTDISGFLQDWSFNGNAGATATEWSEFLFQSYLEIVIGDRQKLKIPAWEFLSYVKADTYVAAPGVNILLAVTKTQSNRNLRYPIIFNASEQITINFVTTTAGATNFDSLGCRIEFKGFKYDKLEWFTKQYSQGNSFDILNYTIYDVQTLTPGAATDYNLFSNSNKPQTDYSKILPAATGESFTAEAIEIVFASVKSGLDVQLTDLNKIQLVINVNDVLFYSGNAGCQYSIISSLPVAGGAGFITHLVKSNFILPEPVVFGSNSKVDIRLTTPALENISALPFISMLKGTLSRSKV